MVDLGGTGGQSTALLVWLVSKGGVLVVVDVVGAGVGPTVDTTKEGLGWGLGATVGPSVWWGTEEPVATAVGAAVVAAVAWGTRVVGAVVVGLGSVAVVGVVGWTKRGSSGNT